MKGQLIGEGNTAEVYAWGDREILKLFRKGLSWNIIDREYQISKVVSEQGLPVPKVMQQVELEDRCGIIYERLNGKSLLDLIMKKPFSTNAYVKQLADLQYQVHKSTGLELPKYKETLERNIRETDSLTDAQKKEVLKLLDQLPEGDALCHGDFHPGNIMVDGDNYYILDWMTAAAGNPAADVARTILLLRDAGLPDQMPRLVKLIIGRMRKNMAAAFIKQYLKISGIQIEEINKWRIVIAAARLVEWIPPSEKKALLDEIIKATN